MNFGVKGNGQVCDCGKHEGVGKLSAGDRAARYKHMLHTMPSYVYLNQKRYLQSWEAYHGAVSYAKDAKGVPRIQSSQPAHATTTPHVYGWNDN